MNGCNGCDEFINIILWALIVFYIWGIVGRVDRLEREIEIGRRCEAMRESSAKSTT
jgi:hypothetical protein